MTTTIESERSESNTYEREHARLTTKVEAKGVRVVHMKENMLAWQPQERAKGVRVIQLQENMLD